MTSKGTPSSSVSHTDTAKGQGGGRLTKDPDDTSPTNRNQARGENAKDSNFRSPSGDLSGQASADPEDVAGRMRSTGKDSGIA